MRRLDVVRGLRVALLGAAIVYLVLVVYLALRRCTYPFELEWMEGAMVDHVDRVAHGTSIYVEPTLDFVPFIYAPLFYWIAAAVAKVIGIGFTALRIVSIASMLGSFALVYKIVMRDTADRVAGVIAAGAFAASYVRSSDFFDIGRVDSLSLVLALAAIYVMRNLRERRWFWLLGAALLGLSFLAKQSSLLLAFALMAHEVWVQRKRAIPFVGATLVATVGLAFVLNWTTDGWFLYYTWDLPRAHPIVHSAIVGFWTDDLAPAYAIAAVFGGYFLIASTPLREGARWFHLLAAGGMVASAWTGRLHDGGWPNVLIPAFAALSILFGLGFSHATRVTSNAAESRRLQSFVAASALLQLAVLVYDPRPTLPTASDAALGRGLIEKMRAVDGEVFIPNHSWYARMAGKRPHAHRMAMEDVMRGDPDGEGRWLSDALRQAVAEGKWSMILVDDSFFDGYFMGAYVPVPPPFPSREGFYTPTGNPMRPQKMFVRP